jgi:putative ABC transport system permease protein
LSPLDRKLLRDLWRIRGQALAIAFVIGAGLALFTGMLGTLTALAETRDAYYAEYRFADVFASAVRAPERLVLEASDLPGVREADGRIVVPGKFDVPGLDQPVTATLVSLPRPGQAGLNRVALRDGRMPDSRRRDEILISQAFATANHLRPGDALDAVMDGHRQRLLISGIALSPDYTYALAPGALLPDDRLYGIAWMSRDALESAYDLEGAFNQLSLTLDRDIVPGDVLDEVDRLLAPYGGVGAITRKDQLSNWFISNEIRQLRTFGTIVPAIFLAVAGFLLNVVITRLVATEREQIGLMKAFGYTPLESGWHYAKLVLVLSVLGIACGLGGGILLGKAWTQLYTQYFKFPFLIYRPDIGVFTLAGGFALAAALAGTLSALISVVRLPPAEAMRPRPPMLYRHSALARLSGLARAIGRHISQPGRMILRHVARRKGRSSFSVLAMASGVALYVLASFSTGALEEMLRIVFFQAQRQDMSVTFVEPRSEAALYEIAALPGVLRAEPFRSVPATLSAGVHEKRSALIGLLPEPDLNRLIDREERPVRIPEGGLTLSDILADELQVEPGDLVRVSVTEGRRPVVELPVAAVSEQYLGGDAYLPLPDIHRLMGEGPGLNGAYLAIDPDQAAALDRRLKDMPAVAGVSLSREGLYSFRKMMAESMYVMVAINVFFAGLIALGVVYNNARIALSERERELASLRVLGFTRFEISYILLGEITLLTLIALPVGCLMGYGLLVFMTAQLQTELYRIPLYVTPEIFADGCLVVVAATVASGLLILRRLLRLDLIEALKTRE